MNNQLTVLTQFNDALSLQDQKKAREIEALRLKINSMQDRDKEIVAWKQRHQELQKSHSQILEDVKSQTHNSLKNKSVCTFFFNKINYSLFLGSRVKAS